MLWKASVDEILHPSDGFEDVEAPLPGPRNMGAWASGGSQWVHSNFVLRVPPEVNTNFVTTFMTYHCAPVYQCKNLLGYHAR